jgi:hypothetical protein
MMGLPCYNIIVLVYDPLRVEHISEKDQLLPYSMVMHCGTKSNVACVTMPTRANAGAIERERKGR